MARLGINTGITPNDGNGDTLREAGGKINSNFEEIYDYFGDGTNLSFSGSIWEATSSGINTTSNVGVGTTNPRFNLEVGYVGASGTTLWVNGDARITGILTVGTASITLDGISNTVNIGSGVTIDGNSGIISATSLFLNGESISGGGGETYWIQNSTGIHTTSNIGIGTTTASNALTVSGDILVTGITTHQNSISVRQSVTGNEYVSISPFGRMILGSSIGTAAGIDIINNTTSSSAEIFTISTPNVGLYNKKIIVDYGGRLLLGGNLDSSFNNAFTVLDNSGNINLTGYVSAGGTIGASGATVTGTTFTDQLSVSGVSTFIGNVNTSNIFVSDGNYLSVATSGGYGHVLGGPSQDLLLQKTRGTGPISDVSINIKNETLNTGGGSNESVLRIYGDGGLRSYYHTISGGFAIQSERFSVTGGDSSDATPTEVIMKVGSGVTAYGNGDIYSAGSITASSFSGAGVTVTGTTFTDQLSVSGISTFNDDVVFNGQGAVNAYWDAVALNGAFFINNSKLVIGEPGDAYFEAGTGSSAQLSNGGLIIDAGYLLIDAANGDNVAKFVPTIGGDNNVELYSNNSKKFETLGAGVTVTGTTFTDQLSVSGISTLDSIHIPTGITSTNELRFGGLYDDRFFCLQYNSARNGGQGGGLIFTNSGKTFDLESGANFSVKSGTTTSIIANSDAGVELNYAGNTKFETLGAGVTVTGTTFTDQLYVSGISTFLGEILTVGDIITSGNITAATNLEILGISTVGDVQVSAGIITASVGSSSGIVTYYGDTSNAVDGRWILSGDGTNYTFTGIGITSGNSTDPKIYLARARVYEFVNTQPSSHPFVIRDSDGGSEWTAGVSTSTDGTNDILRFEVPMDAPNTLFYQCTVHSGMGNTITVYPTVS